MDANVPAGLLKLWIRELPEPLIVEDTYELALEAGRKNEFHFSTFEKLAKACGLKPCELIDFDVEPSILAGAPPENVSRSASNRRPRKIPKPGKKPD